MEQFLGTDFTTDLKLCIFNGLVFGFDVRFARAADEDLGVLQMKATRILNNGETELNSAQISKHLRFPPNFPPEIVLQ